MTSFFVVVALSLVLLSLPFLWRIAAGPRTVDRAIALSGFGTIVATLIVVLGLTYGRLDLFVDISLGLFLLNLITTFVLARYVQERGGA